MINVLEYLEESSKNFKDKIAFEDSQKSITFHELKEKAVRIGSALFSEEIQKPIAVYLPKSIDAITSFMAVLYSGNFYVPLDINNPLERIEAICNNIEPKAIITDEQGAIKLKDLFKNIIIYQFDDLNNYSGPLQSQYLSNIDTDIAYIINTSGSTGTPKGVAVSHRSIINYIEWASKTYDICDKDVIGNQAPLYFDNSVLDIYSTLKNGSKLLLTPESLFIFPVKLLQYYEEKNVNMFFFVPSVLVTIANMDLLKLIKPEFNKILFAGEVMPTKQLNYWKKNYPQALFSNLYGPTEITVDCTYYIVDRDFMDDEPLPIGRPCRNSDILILDEEDKLVKECNVQGELCVRGSSLALGYYNDFSKTESVFCQNPLNTHYPEKIYRTGDIVYYNEFGEIIYKGRKDFQIKHLGYRIELGEIETAMGVISDIKNVCVIYNTKKSKISMCYEADYELKPKDVVLALQNKLPRYMIPTELHRIEKFPLNTNGKIDRKLLQKLIEE